MITRIEVVRIRPQSYAGEPVEGLIEDPWQVFDCAPDPAGCAVEFSDPDFGTGRRDALYYVRAIEAPHPAAHGALPDCDIDAQDDCTRANPSPAGPDDDRPAPLEARAWSSPIFVDYRAAAG